MNNLPDITGYAVVPSTIDEIKEQIRRSEKQIEEGRYYTLEQAVSHFYQLG